MVVVFVPVRFVSLKMPPPYLAAEFPLIVLCVTSKLPRRQNRSAIAGSRVAADRAVRDGQVTTRVIDAAAVLQPSFR